MRFPALRHTKIDGLLSVISRGARRQYGELVSRIVGTGLAQDKDARPDLFASMTNEENLQDERPIPHSEVFQEAVFFLPAGAGADVTWSVICALLFYLSRNAGVNQDLAYEIRSRFKNGVNISGGSELAGCEYLRACIDETIRMSPTISSTVWREEVPDPSDRAREPLMIDGHVIPPGTQVSISICSLHHDERYSLDPFTFNPDRCFALDASERQRKQMSDAFVPFSLGTRSCAGKSMAYLETNLAIAKILCYVDFEAPSGRRREVGAGRRGMPGGRGRVNEYQLYDVFVSNHDGPYLVFHQRGACEELGVE